MDDRHRGQCVKHAGPEALNALEPMLGSLRRLDRLKENKRSVFYRKSRAFLHFHEAPAGLYCDVRLDPADDFERFRVTTDDERTDLLNKVEALLRESPL